MEYACNPLSAAEKYLIGMDVDPFSDEALGERTPEAIAQDDRQAADFAGFDPQYHAALVVIANEPGAGRFARAINLVAAIFGKTSQEVLRDACVIAGIKL